MEKIEKKGRKCAECGRASNHLAKCYECKKFFCYDHICGGMVNHTMRDTERIRDVCEKCKEEFTYLSAGSGVTKKT